MTTGRILLALLLASLACPADENLGAPNPAFPPLDQLRVSGNACGPAALLNAFGFGGEKWREIGAAVPGKDDRQRLTYVIRGYGLKPSRHLDRLRWTKTRGVNLLDLTDMGNELRGKRWTPKLRSEVFVQARRESRPELLRRIHSRLARSMRQGLPPIASLQRLATAKNEPDNPLGWRLVDGHYIVIIGLPAKLSRTAQEFPIRYVDPWGGKILQGQIAIDPAHSYPAAIVQTPKTEVGKKEVKAGERSIVTLSGALGAF